MTDYTKEELEIKVNELEDTNYKLEEQIVNLQSQLELIQNKSHRKSQVLEILKENGPISILEIAKKLNITTKNVSSQLTYLRSDGYKICTDHNGKKFIIIDE